MSSVEIPVNGSLSQRPLFFLIPLFDSFADISHSRLFATELSLHPVISAFCKTDYVKDEVLLFTEDSIISSPPRSGSAATLSNISHIKI